MDDKSENLTIFVTGSSGYLGQNLIKKLATDPRVHRLICLAANPEKMQNLSTFSKIEWISGRFPEIQINLKDVNTVVHTAALRPPTGNSKEIIQTNIRGTQKLVDACKVFNVSKFINCSTQAAERVMFSQQDHSKMSTESAYGLSKLKSEEIVKTLNRATALNLRLTRIYGVGSGMRWNELPHLFCRNAVENASIPIVGSGKFGIDFLYLNDAINAILKCIFLKIKTQVTLKIGSGKTTSINSLARTVIETSKKLGLSEVKIHNIMDTTKTAKPAIQLDIEKSKKLLNWKPIFELDEGINNVMVKYLSEKTGIISA